MNERKVQGIRFGVGDQQNDVWPVFEVTMWDDGTATVRLVATFFDHETGDEFCRRWASERPTDPDTAGFR
jgi:hypothetical protein